MKFTLMVIRRLCPVSVSFLLKTSPINLNWMNIDIYQHDYKDCKTSLNIENFLAFTHVHVILPESEDFIRILPWRARTSTVEI